LKEKSLGKLSLIGLKEWTSIITKKTRNDRGNI
jgi:hypothetical protein